MPGTDVNLRNTEYARQHAAPFVPAAKADTAPGFSFDDLLDIINPLQHIPVVSTLYRHLTGDKIGTPEKSAGDALYGGLTGFLCSVGDTMFEEITGKGVGDTVYAALIGGDDAKPATAVAANDNTPPPIDAITDTAGMPALEPTQTSVPQAVAAYRASGRLLAAY